MDRFRDMMKSRGVSTLDWKTALWMLIQVCTAFEGQCSPRANCLSSREMDEAFFSEPVKTLAEVFNPTDRFWDGNFSSNVSLSGIYSHRP